MKATIIYANWEQLRDTSVDYHAGEVAYDHPEFYTRVADVDVQGVIGNRETVCEAIYVAANKRTAPGVIGLPMDFAQTFRSMSVGDLIAFEDGSVYVVKPIGFVQDPAFLAFAIEAGGPDADAIDRTWDALTTVSRTVQ